MDLCFHEKGVHNILIINIFHISIQMKTTNALISHPNIHDLYRNLNIEEEEAWAAIAEYKAEHVGSSCCERKR